MTRRDFLVSGALAPFALNLELRERATPVSFGAITDVHFGLAPDAYQRLQAFVQAVKARPKLDFVVQLGDFCHPVPEAETDRFLALWNEIDLPKHHVLGNHDMDRGSKQRIMRMWGMPHRYGSFEAGGYRFLTLDLNHFRKGGQLHAYANGNYFTDNATHNWADPAQLAWLERELTLSDKPTLILSHQPLGIRDQDGSLPPEQAEVLNILAQHNRSRRGKVVAVLFGHLHVDRLEFYEGFPCLCLNSASYFWQSGMHPYRDPLFAFIRIDADGVLRIEGRKGEFAKAKPPGDTIGCSASIQNRRLSLKS